MFTIKGEGLFIGDLYIADGMKMADDLKEKGFAITPNNCCVNLDNKATKVRRWGFMFECGTKKNEIVIS